MADGSGAAQARLLAQRLRAVPEDLRREMGKALREATQPIVDQAKVNAGWSSRIPAAITAKASFSAAKPGVTIRVSTRLAPHARPYEGASGRGDTFRHPVFDNRDNWVSQATRPFLFPAVRAKRDGVVDDLNEAVDTTLARHGF